MKAQFLCSLLLLGLVTNSCIPFKKQPLLLKVESRTWTTKQFLKEMEYYLEELKNSPETPEQEEKIKKIIVEELILQTLIENWSKKNNVSVAKAKSFKSLSQFPLFYKFTSRRLKKKLNQQNLRKAFLEKLKSPSNLISKKTRLAFYRKNKKMFLKPAACKLDHILVDSKIIAESLRKQLLAGGSFSRIASEHSKSPEKKNKGSLGWVPKGTLEIFDKACSLPTNRISPILESSYGFHILKAKEKRRASYASFSRSEKEILKIIKENLLKTRFEAWLKEELKKTPVFINKKLLDQIHIQYRKKEL